MFDSTPEAPDPKFLVILSTYLEENIVSMSKAGHVSLRCRASLNKFASALFNMQFISAWQPQQQCHGRPATPGSIVITAR